MKSVVNKLPTLHDAAIRAPVLPYTSREMDLRVSEELETPVTGPTLASRLGIIRELRRRINRE
jgi:hypothetical protein